MKIPPGIGIGSDQAWPPAPEQFRLANGVTVYVIGRWRSAITEVRIVSRGGFTAPPARLSACGAVALSLIGTCAELRDALERVEGVFATQWTHDAAIIELSLLGSKLRETFDALRRALERRIIDPSTIRRMRETHRGRALRQNSAMANLPLQILPPVLFSQDSRYNRPLVDGGAADSISRASTQDLSDWYDLYLTPSSTNLVIVSQFGSRPLKMMLEETLGAWRGPDFVQSFDGPEKILNSPGEDARKFCFGACPRLPQAYIALGFLTVSRTDPAEPALMLAHAILAGMFSSRLNQKLREQEGWTYGVRSFLVPTRERALWLIDCLVQHDRAKPAVDVVLSELAQLASGAGLLSEELERGKRWLRANIESRYESCSSAADELAQAVTYGLSPGFQRELIDQMERLTLQDVRAVYKAALEQWPKGWLLAGD